MIIPGIVSVLVVRGASTFPVPRFQPQIGERDGAEPDPLTGMHRVVVHRHRLDLLAESRVIEFHQRIMGLVGRTADGVGDEHDAEATVETVADGMAAHPTLSEAIKEAGLVALGRAIHVPNRKRAKAPA